jgi:hypothetical protein
MGDLLEQVKNKYAKRITTAVQIESGLAVLEQAGVLEAATKWAEASGITVEDIALNLCLGPSPHRPSIKAEATSHRDHWADIAADIRRIADHLSPVPPEKVGTTYVAEKLDCTTVWVTEMIHSGKLPAKCVVPGTGNGKKWKFFRARIDEWIGSR